MITLSKSKLLKFAELSKLQIDGRSEFAYTNRLEHFAELVLSDRDVCMEHVPENEEPRQQLTARIRELEEQNARLKAESEYKYVEQVLSPIRLLLEVARCAETLADGVMDDGNGLHIMFAPDFDKLSEALDALDYLPDDKPGYTLSAATKAAWALRDLVGDTNG